MPLDARWEPEFLYRFEASLDVSPVGLTPEGLRFAVRFDGTVCAGLLWGARVWGVDHYLLRNDGVGIIDAGKTLSLGSVHVYEHARAYCLPPDGLELPPLAKLAEPGFAWPDLRFPIVGFSMFRAGSAAHVQLNRAVAQIEGSANFATGALEISTFVLEP